MKKLQLSLCAVGAYMLLVATLGVFGAGPATGQNGRKPETDVRVINTPIEPVPVSLQGAAQIDTSTPLPVRDFDEAARRPISFRLRFDNERFTVPAGTRLVIQYVSGRIEAAGFAVDAGLGIFGATGGPEFSVHRFPVSLAGTAAGRSYYLFGATTHIMADPGAQILLQQLGFSSHVFVDCQVNGYLVDVP